MSTAAVMAPIKKPNAVMGFLRTAAPFIAAGLGAAGPVGALAGSIFQKAIGSNAPPKTVAEAEGQYANALAAVNAPADIIAAAQKAEEDFKSHALQMGFDSLEKLESLENADRSDARARQIAIRDNTPQVGFYLLLLLFALSLIAVCRFPIPADNKAMAFSMIGSLGTLVVMAATYFYGTTSSSSRKTELLAQAGPIDFSK